jgi:hypothetical protein
MLHARRRPEEGRWRQSGAFGSAALRETASAAATKRVNDAFDFSRTERITRVEPIMPIEIAAKRAPRVASVGIALGAAHRRAAELTLALLLATGAGWLAVHYATNPDAASGTFGSHEGFWLKLHGAAAMLGLLLFGSLLSGHVFRGLRGTRNRYSGIALAGLGLALVISGYLLYYIADEATHPVISAIHWVTGLGLLPPFIWHRHAAARRRRLLSARR